ncbi:autotransporter assembly complex protein TamA [Humitalea rosea]|uniref:autotransporter assembly complex protein TamA n=1 Tax=Humitalea rosea TaxID=990373 RepID=UPI000DAE1FF6|nr:autotransporter assembly complex family protein [Humitalea rosea]
MPRVLAAVATLLVALPWTLPSPAQEAPPAEAPAEAEVAGLAYTLEIAPSGDDALDAALLAASRLQSLIGAPPQDMAGLLARVAEDLGRLPEVFHAEGYWGGGIGAEVAGRPAETVSLLTTPATPVPVRLLPRPGPRYSYGVLTLRPAGDAAPGAVAAAGAELGLTPGDPARIEPVLTAEAGLIRRLREAGYPLASVVGREAVVDYDRHVLDIAWRIEPGPAAVFGTPVVEGATRTDRAFLERVAGRLAGQPFSPATLERSRRDLSALGVFAAVRAAPGSRLGPGNSLPVTFTVQERPVHAIGASAAYETNYGPSARLWWEHRNLFGRAERFRIEADVSRLGDGGTENTNARLSATLRKPEIFGTPNLTLTSEIAVLRERLDAYSRDAVLGTLGLERKLTELWTVSGGLSAETGRAAEESGPFRTYTLFSVPLVARRDDTTSLLDPRRGSRITLAVAPSYEMEAAEAYAVMKASGSVYLDLLGEGRGVLALRGVLGSLAGAEPAQVPPQQRFFAGGGGSVRGYDYQSIGPRTAGNRARGGASLVETSVEWRQQISGPWGAAVFIDGGSVGDSATPDFGELRFGAGAGVRYNTPIGPIRVDVAVPLVGQTGSSAYGIYIGLGQAF